MRRAALAFFKSDRTSAILFIEEGDVVKMETDNLLWCRK